MSIHAISGKPGGGKSLYSLRLIVEELRHGHRAILTNVPLKLGELSAYLQKNYPNENVDVLGRVYLLDDDQAAEFWTYRPAPNGCFVRVKRLSKQEWQSGERPDYTHIKDTGVFYAIDEVHNFFGARQWQDTGRDVLFYLSQHRKMTDTLVWITQAVNNVDKQFRSVTQDYTYLRNLNKEKMGLFKMPALFVRRTYGSPATDTASALETGTFKLDVSGLAACYDTSAGVGIHGRAGADVGERRSGIHWLVFVIGLPMLLIGIYKFAPSAIAGYFTPSKNKQIQSAVNSAQTAFRATNSPVLVPDRPAKPAPAPARSEPIQERVEDPVWIIGRKTETGLHEFYLSDGSIIRSKDGNVKGYGDDFIMAGGRIYKNAPQSYYEKQREKNTVRRN